MKKNLMTAAIMTAAVLALAGCGNSSDSNASAEAQTETTAANETTAEETTEAADETESEAADNTVIGVPNPWTDHKDLAEAEAEAGFEIELPEEINGTTADAFRTLDGEDATLEIIYHDGKGEETARIRKAPGSSDISGDYTDYAETVETEVNDAKVDMKGSDGRIMLATWEADGYSYSVSTGADGLGETDMIAIVEVVK